MTSSFPGQLSSTFSNSPSYKQDGQFYDTDLPYCLASAPAVKPAPVQPPPFANQSLPLQIWAGPLADGSVAVVLLNTGVKANNITVTASWGEVGLPAGARVKVRDLFSHRDVGFAVGSVSAAGENNNAHLE